MENDNEEDNNLCQICNEPKHDLHHNSTTNHRFHFMKWSYNRYRKALVKNRHGVEVTVQEEVRNNFRFIFDYSKNKGKYVVKVSPEQLQMHENTIAFKCTIKNTMSKDSIRITNIGFLHGSEYFQIKTPNDFDGVTFPELLPMATYNFKVIFTTEVPTNASYKIPLTCDLQTADNKNTFSIIRTFLVVVDDLNQEAQKKVKSPFTSEPWKDIQRRVPATKQFHGEDEYPVPQKYMKILKHGLTRFQNMTTTQEIELNEAKTILRALTPENYEKFWHLLLWMEERALALMLMKYNMSNVIMDIKKGNILILEVPGLAEKRPSVVPGDVIQIRLHNDHTVYHGSVTRVNEKTIEIEHVDDELMEYIKADPVELDVAFVVGRLAFERMHRGVQKVVASGMVANLFPRNVTITNSSNIYNLHDSDFHYQEIVSNNEQKNAVIKILNSTQKLPYIVFGPPGTGKTITIVEAILQLKKHTKKRILVCAPANSACDVIAMKLLKYCDKKELLRYHSSTRETFTLNEELVGYSNIDEDGDFTNVDFRQMCTYRILITTLTLIGKFSRDFRPDCVFVDEAAQASEPETDIAIGLLKDGKQVVLAGDPKQLGPMVTDCASKFGLGVSLLERLMKYDVYKPNPRTGTYNSNLITMLKLNFRSHPNILLIPNQEFYGNNLEPRSTSAKKDPVASIAIYPRIKSFKHKKKGEALEFCSVSSKEKKEGSSPSFFNLMEAKMVVKYVKALINLQLPSDYKVTPDQIGVVTPYKRQVFKVKENLRSNGFENIEVGTTESFQGREKRIIIITTVRAQHSLLLLDRKYKLGFVKNEQRFNVAVTRAISKLIVIGCPLVLAKDTKWEMYMKLCKDLGTYFGNDIESSSDEFKKGVIMRMNRFQAEDQQYNK